MVTRRTTSHRVGSFIYMLRPVLEQLRDYWRQSQSISRHLKRQDACAGVANRRSYTASCARFNQKNQAPASARAADFRRAAAVLPGYGNQLVYLRCGDTRGITSSQLPLFP